jgi:Protein kinase domain
MIEPDIGGYTILGVVGHGSTGTVYKATAPDGTTVAVKRITAHADEKQREALRREAAALEAFHHPSVVRFIDLVDTPTELAIVTEFFGGGSLRDYLENAGPFPANEVVAMLSPIAAALGEAHRRGILHRDIKPSNILRRADGSTVLADFGLALTDELDDPAASRTNNAALGSASYLDPEVLDGAAPTPASDIYALGVVGYELLTRATPFPGDGTLAVLRRADKGEFVRLDRNVHGELADEVERAFRRNSNERFATADDLLRAWQRAIDGPQTNGEITNRAETVSIPDSGASATTSFTVPTRPTALWEAEPVTEPRNWKRVGAYASILAALGVIGGGAAWKMAQRHAPAVNGVVNYKVYCDPALTAQCVDTFNRTPDGISVKFAGDDVATRFAVGTRADALRVSNFFCGPSETLALYRPKSGTIYYFREWPLPGKKTEIRADVTGIKNAVVVVSDYDNNGCGDIGLEQGDGRVWFLPSQQQARLRLVAEGDAP